MPRRCLDCDHIYAALRTCPQCGSSKQLYLDSGPQGPEPIVINAWLAVGNALMVTGATLANPGLGIGSALFAQGFCAVLILVGTERAQRAMAPLWVVSAFCYVAYAVLTDQDVFVWLAFAAAIGGFLHALPWQSVANGIGLIVGWTLSVALVVGLLAHALGMPPPGWWHGKHPDFLSAGKKAAEVMSAPQDLPETFRY